MVPTIETERLILRPITAQDLPAVYSWAGDKRVAQYMVYTCYKSQEDGKEWIEHLYQNPNDCDFGFQIKETGKLIGSGGAYFCTNVPPDNKNVWRLGYNLHYDYWHKGYVTEAVKAIINYLKTEKHAKIIEGRHAYQNERSGTVMTKCGLTYKFDTSYSKLDGSETFPAKGYRLYL